MKNKKVETVRQKLDFSESRARNRSNFDLVNFLKDRDSQKIHINFKGVSKVTISNDKDYLIFGGDGLHVLYLGEDGFGIVRFDKHRGKNPNFLTFLGIKFSTLKVLENDNILTVEPISNDLVIWDTQFKEVLRLKGLKSTHQVTKSKFFF